MLEGLNRYIGALLATLTATAIIAAVGSWGMLLRMDERLSAVERRQEKQAIEVDAVSDSATELARIVAVLQDRQQRDGG